MLLPVFIYIFGHYQDPTVTFAGFMEMVPTFPFVQEVFDNVSQTAFGQTFEINAYLSYCVGVEIFHVLFDVVVFIPRLAHKWISAAVQDD